MTGRHVLGVSWFLVRVLVGRTDLLEEFFDDFPENQGGSLVIERDAPAVLFIAGRVLEMCPTEIWMVLVLVPASVKARIRVGVVDTEPIVGGPAGTI